MKALVQFTGLDSNLRENVTSHIRKNWSEVTISGVASNIPPSEGHSPPALLIIGSNTALFVNSKVPLIEFIEVDSTFSMEQVLFWVDAKLGRLTKSDMVYTKSKVSRKSAISRRQFLLGIAGRIPHADDAPVVLENSCEAKFGCSKCVDACPAPGSLRIEKESVIVSSEHCIRCGLCAGVCPVAAIQMPKFPEDAYRGLIAAVDSFPAPQKTLVITCDERGFTPEPWMDVEIVPGVGFAGVRQLALADGFIDRRSDRPLPRWIMPGERKRKTSRKIDLFAHRRKWPRPSLHRRRSPPSDSRNPQASPKA